MDATMHTQKACQLRVHMFHCLRFQADNSTLNLFWAVAMPLKGTQMYTSKRCGQVCVGPMIAPRVPDVITALTPTPREAVKEEESTPPSTPILFKTDSELGSRGPLDRRAPPPSCQFHTYKLRY